MPKQGVILLNLGSPDSTETSDVRRYLREFLMDERVLDAELKAVRVRSPTPAAAALRARQLMGAHLGHELPDVDAAPHQD